VRALPTRPRPSRLTALLLVPTLAFAVSGCGGAEDADEGAGGMDGMSMEDMASMNEPDATPADEVRGAELSAGEFQVLDTAPPGSDEVAGTAWVAQNRKGTTVTVRLTGLEPGEVYASHLHAQTCETDDGGPHFAFEEGGPEVPPNEVHLGFTADDDGTGEATVTNDREVGDRAPAVVVHPADAQDNRLACADLQQGPGGRG